MAFQFPINPTVGQLFQATPALTFKWDGTGWNPITTLPDFWIVGDIHLSMSPVNPAGRFGGTWVLISQGRCLVGADGGLGSAGGAGGSFTTTLNQSHLPSANLFGSTGDANQNHSHGFTDNYHDGNGSSPSIATQSGFGYGINPTGHGAQTEGFSNNHQHSVTVSLGGGNQPFNIVQPYLAVYMWQKTA